MDITLERVAGSVQIRTSNDECVVNGLVRSLVNAAHRDTQWVKRRPKGFKLTSSQPSVYGNHSAVALAVVLVV
jgi:hypothetical protein